MRTLLALTLVAVGVAGAASAADAPRNLFMADKQIMSLVDKA